MGRQNLQEKAVSNIVFLQILHRLALEITCGIKHLRVVQGGLLRLRVIKAASWPRIRRREARACAGRQAQPGALSGRCHVPGHDRRMAGFELTHCDLKRRGASRPLRRALCLYRTGRGHAVTGAGQLTSYCRQHHDHAHLLVRAGSGSHVWPYGPAAGRAADRHRSTGAAARHFQPQHPCAAQAGVRRAARAYGATRTAQAAYRVRHARRLGQEADLIEAQDIPQQGRVPGPCCLVIQCHAGGQEYEMGASLEDQKETF